MGWFEFIAAFVGFFLVHNGPTRPEVKPRLIALLSPRGFTLVYSLLSLAALYWVLMAAGRAPVIILWHWAPWQNYVPLSVMAVVLLILGLSIGRANPFSFGGGSSDQFDPNRAGIIRWTPHPIVMAMRLWALAHLVPNGTLAHVIVFGIFAGFTFLGTRLIDRRKKRENPEWQELRDQMALSPRFHPPSSRRGLAIRLVLAALAYVSLVHLHATLFGVSPLI